jgi:NAD(P)-dependent dehydrogenase (short-subunit alcohol dehydrogenase family)
MKSVFITGGTSGMGLGLVKRYHKMGWRVAACGRNKQKFLEAIGNEIPSIQFYQVDVTKKEETVAAVREFAKGGLDMVIACAGLSYANKSRIPDFDHSYKVVHTNLLGTMYTFEPAIEYFLKQGHGHLVAISSIAGLNGLPGVSAYSAAKSGVIKLCESFYMDLGKDNIDVTCVCPGFVDTPLTQVNPHPMPFLLPVEVAVDKIIQGIEKKKMRVYFPFLFTLAVRLLSILPRRLYAFIMGSGKFNYSREH